MHGPSQKPTVPDTGPPRGAEPRCRPRCEPLLRGGTHGHAHCMSTCTYVPLCAGRAGGHGASGRIIEAEDQKHLPCKSLDHLEASEDVSGPGVEGGWPPTVPAAGAPGLRPPLGEAEDGRGVAKDAHFLELQHWAGQDGGWRGMKMDLGTPGPLQGPSSQPHGARLALTGDEPSPVPGVQLGAPLPPGPRPSPSLPAPRLLSKASRVSVRGSGGPRMPSILFILIFRTGLQNLCFFLSLLTGPTAVPW